MQTSHTTSSTAATASLGRRIVAASWKPALFAVLMWLSAAAGAIPIPGTPVPITLQTFVVMLAGLMLPWRQAGSAVAAYLAAGAVGLPVFAGGASTMALVGPSAGFLFGFLPGVIVIALLRGSPPWPWLPWASSPATPSRQSSPPWPQPVCPSSVADLQHSYIGGADRMVRAVFCS